MVFHRFPASAAPSPIHDVFSGDGWAHPFHRAAMKINDPVVYRPLAAFGQYSGRISAIRPNGLVDIILNPCGGAEMEITRITVAESIKALRPGTCAAAEKREDYAR